MRRIFPAQLAPLALSLLFAPVPLSGQCPGPHPPGPQKPWTLQTDFGFVNTAGNTSTTTLNAGDVATVTAGPWTLAQTFAVVYGRTDGKRSAENYVAGLRGDYLVTPGLGVYLGGRYTHDKFAGISRRFEEGSGLSLKAVASTETELTFEAGAVLNQQWSTDGTKDNFAAGRGAMRYKRMLSKAAYFKQLAEILPNFLESKDVRVNSESALVAPISSRIALKASYVIKFDNEPEPGFETTDRYLTSGLQVVF
jgi:putative salt-induced outer membrane protein